ncbi:cupin domain-containing protein [Derxia lacustris]|uniref:cupin domain-containing protein n=1 Tax=Derxia lacustris TaxID=764842 RepID=UPI000A1717CA|nr:cupin domain-containing protein [Derxia lacustris]
MSQDLNSSPQPAAPRPDDALATGLLADALAPIVPAAPQAGALRARLLERAAQSRAASHGVHTVRRRDGGWQPYVKGVRYKLLRNTPDARSLLVEFAPGATLPAHRHAQHEECVVLGGSLVMGDLRLGRGDYHVAPARSRHSGLVSPDGALIYLRGAAIGSHGSAVREVIGAWLPGSREHATTVFAGDDGWRDFMPGVREKKLWARDGYSSRLYRFEAGAVCPGHGHAALEECVMLDGDAYFGDILVCAGDYQSVDAGAVHGEVMSDGGALFFVHGADDAGALGHL